MNGERQYCNNRLLDEVVLRNGVKLKVLAKRTRKSTQVNASLSQHCRRSGKSWDKILNACNASLQNQNLRTDLRRVGKWIRKSQKAVHLSHIQMTCDQLVSTSVGWPNDEKLALTSESPRIKSSQVHASWMQVKTYVDSRDFIWLRIGLKLVNYQHFLEFNKSLWIELSESDTGSCTSSECYKIEVIVSAIVPAKIKICKEIKDTLTLTWIII